MFISIIFTESLNIEFYFTYSGRGFFVNFNGIFKMQSLQAVLTVKYFKAFLESSKRRYLDIPNDISGSILSMAI